MDRRSEFPLVAGVGFEEVVKSELGEVALEERVGHIHIRVQEVVGLQKGRLGEVVGRKGFQKVDGVVVVVVDNCRRGYICILPRYSIVIVNYPL